MTVRPCKSGDTTYLEVENWAAINTSQRLPIYLVQVIVYIHLALFQHRSKNATKKYWLLLYTWLHSRAVDSPAIHVC